MPKIVKSCLNLSKLRPKYYRSFFLGHVVYAVIIILALMPRPSDGANRRLQHLRSHTYGVRPASLPLPLRIRSASVPLDAYGASILRPTVL